MHSKKDTAGFFLMKYYTLNFYFKYPVRKSYGRISVKIAFYGVM